MTLIRDDKSDVNSIGGGRYSSYLQSIVTLQQKAPKGDNKDDTATRHVHMHVQPEEGDTKLLVEEARTLARNYMADI